MGYTCSTCHQYHEELPMDVGYDFPAFYDPKDKESAKTLTSDTFILNNESFFVRGVLELPIIDSDKVFNYGVWVSLSDENFKRYPEVDGTDLGLQDPPHFGWFANSIRGYPETLNLKTHVHFQVKEFRPKIELEHTDHLLSIEQHHGITIQRVHEIVQPYLT